MILFLWQVERGLKNFPQDKRSKGMYEKRKFDDYNEEKEK